MDARWSKRLRAAVALVCAGAVMLNPSTAAAFKAKAHVGVANTALAELDAAFRSANTFGFGPIALQNDEVMDAVRAYPEYFRAGAMGPDSFPDLVGGQLWVHVNNGCENGLDCSVAGKYLSDVPLERRPTDKWRAIDYGMYQLWKAFQESPGPGRQQALSFSYGYLAHEMSDGFAHAWMNDWTRDFFTIFEGGGLFGPLTEELQHITLEGYLDKRLVAGTAVPEMRIATPVAFLNKVYQDPVVQGITAGGPAGRFGGKYYEKLIWFRDLMYKLADHRNWAGLVGTDAAPVIGALLEVESQLGNVQSLGSGVLNPIRDIEDYFRRRGVVFDTLLNEWVALSGCVAQNMIAKTALAPGEIVTTDACKAIEFEPDADTKDLFEGNLDSAAYYGEAESDFDFGTLGNNAKKILKFLEQIASVGVRLSITEDVRSVRLVLDVISKCNTQIIDWKQCDQFCGWLEKSCTKIVWKAGCITCPTKNGVPNCGGYNWLRIPDWRRILCLAEPFCFACASSWMETVIDEACLATRDANVPLCTACAEKNAICNGINVAAEVLQVIPDAIDKALQPLVDRLKDEIVDALMRKYFGPELQAFYEAFRELEDDARQAKPGFMVNLAFLREDAQADPAYLNALLTNLLGLGGTVVDNTLEVGAAITDTTSRTVTAGTKLLKAYLACVDNTEQCYENIWHGVVSALIQIARNPGQGLDIVKTMESSEFAWLDAFNFKTPHRTYERRFAKFMALAKEVELLGKMRGPTLRKYRGELGLGAGLADPEGEIDPHRVHVTHNAVELVKLGFLGKEGIRALLLRGGDGDDPRQASQICGTTPHIACDVIQSLDDPSTIRATPPSSTGVDPNLAVAAWYSNKVQWGAGGVKQDPALCRTHLTDFPLANSDLRVANLYDKLFQYPPPCRAVNDLRAVGATTSSLDLAWSAGGTDVESFELERRPDGGGAFASVRKWPGGVTRVTDAGLARGTTYWYRLKAQVRGGPARYSNVIRATTAPLSDLPAGVPAWLPAVLKVLE